MKTSKSSVHNILLAAAMALSLLGGAASADERPSMLQAGHGDEDGQSRPAPERGGPDDDGPPRGGPGFGFGRPSFFRGVELTDAQQDKIFAILHAEAPYLREQSKAEAKARTALHALAKADQYDDAKAASLAQAAATADANIALQHVRTRQKLLAVLTPEQRKQQAEDKPGRPPRP